MEAWLFPGQGAQQRGMGEPLFPAYPGLVAAANEVLGYDIAEFCRTDPEGRLRDTRFAQPALFVVEALTYLERAEDRRPEVLAGHSLGEYGALFAAGCFDFATGVRLVRERGELMGRERGGAMAAVLGPVAAAVPELLAELGFDDLDVANDNAPDQVVVSGPADRLAGFGPEVEHRGGRWVPLAVSAAFHSRAMARAAQEFGRFLDGFAFADPAVPVVANVTARPYAAGTLKDLLVRQIRHPVRWKESMRHLMDLGVTDIVEVGPGTVLRGLWRANRRAYEPGAPAAVPRPTPQLTPQPAPSSDPTPEPEPRPKPATASSQTSQELPMWTPETLGSAAFRRDYGVKYAYLAGAMYHGIASTDLVVRMGRAGLMGFFGAGGLSLAEVEAALRTFGREFGSGRGFGMNLLCTPDNPELENALVDLYLREGVRYVEAAAYLRLTAPLVRYRFSGAHHDREGRPVVRNHVVAKVSRPEVATAFLSPPPPALLERLVAEGGLTGAEAAAARELPVSDDICVEADSGGHTDGGAALTLLPSMIRLRDRETARLGYPGRVRVGAAGGLGAPEALAAVFMLGADFVVTGSVNQCSPEAGTSDAVKDLLASIGVQDTAYAPAGDLFELGAKVQVVRRGTLFAARANRLYQLWRQFGALEEIDAATRRTVEQDYFGRSFEQVWKETAEYLADRHPQELERARADPRHKAALVMRWYFRRTTEAAIRGDPAERVNFQIHCGPAMGAFNAWAAGGDLEDWRARHVDVIAERLLSGAARCLQERVAGVGGG